MLERAFSIIGVAYILFVLPYTAARRLARLTGPLPPRSRLYTNTAISLGFIGLLAYGVDLVAGGWALTRLRTVPPAPAFLLWTLVPLAASLGLAIAFLWVMHRSGRRESPLLSWMLPQTAGDRAGWVGVSLCAGLFEEYAYRGVCLGVLQYVTGSLPIALALTTLGFGLAHGYQSWVGMLRAGTMGVFFTVPVVLTGSLLPSVVGHVAVDIISGFIFTPLRRRWGLVEEDEVPVPPAAASEATASSPAPPALDAAPR